MTEKKLNAENCLIIIPARLASTRLPNKPLADILGKTMIQRVYEQALAADFADVYIACDGEEIANEIKKFGGKFIITDPNLPSGTDRIFAALKEIEKQQSNKKFEIIINLQGDLPNIAPHVIKAAAEGLIESNTDIATVASIIKNEKEITNPNVVKIAIAFSDENFSEQNPALGKALYFSRAAIPHGVGNFYHHIGIYAYKKSALEKFVTLKPSFLEKRESLEQLRALENQMSIAVRIVDSHPLSVDTSDDLEEIKKFIINSSPKIN